MKLQKKEVIEMKDLDIIIVGGVAGGASAAARARRLSEKAKITIFERGPYVSFANCGLPYHIGGSIKERDALLLHSPESLHARFGIEVEVLHEVVEINREKQEVTVENLSSQEKFTCHYDRLILAPGAQAIKPPIEGIEREGVYFLKTIPDMDAILEQLKGERVKHATVVGGGYIGLEVAENFKERGLEVTVLEMADQVMTSVDREMASIVHDEIRLNGVKLELRSPLKRVKEGPEGGLLVQAQGLDDFETDLIVLALGVEPESTLAKKAGLEVSPRGGIVVDEKMRSSDELIYAIGDAVELIHPLSKKPSQIPLAGPANRQARIAADNIFNKDSTYRGTLGTAICKVFNLAVAMTGLNEKGCKEASLDFETMVVHPMNHAPYYPGACRLSLKVLFDRESGRVLGAQAVGHEGVDKRIDVLSTAIAAKMTVYDLEHLELCYAPPYGAAKDAVNLAGYAAANYLRGDHLTISNQEFHNSSQDDYTVLDVRYPAETSAGLLPGAMHIPLDELRERANEVPKEKEVLVYCQVGHRGYIAQRMLSQMGYRCRNLVGGCRSQKLYEGSTSSIRCCSDPCSPCSEEDTKKEKFSEHELDACGLQCPGPLTKMQERMKALNDGERLLVKATDPGFPADARAWAKNRGHRLLETKASSGQYSALIEKAPWSELSHSSEPSQSARSLEPSDASSNRGGEKALTMVVFSNDLDKAMASMIIANGAAAMGMKASLFFTFWGLNILRKTPAPKVDKTAVEKAFAAMMPQGPEKLSLSKMHFAGMGTAMMKRVMEEKNVTSLADLIEQAQSSGVRFIACTMTMDVMGLKKEELIDGVETGGVATYLASAESSSVNLFI